MNICTVGIDLGKTVFHLVGMDPNGKIVLRKRMSRSQLLAHNEDKQRAPDTLDTTVRQPVRAYRP